MSKENELLEKITEEVKKVIKNAEETSIAAKNMHLNLVKIAENSRKTSNASNSASELSGMVFGTAEKIEEIGVNISKIKKMQQRLERLIEEKTQYLPLDDKEEAAVEKLNKLSMLLQEKYKSLKKQRKELFLITPEFSVELTTRLLQSLEKKVNNTTVQTVAQLKQLAEELKVISENIGYFSNTFAENNAEVSKETKEKIKNFPITTHFILVNAISKVKPRTMGEAYYAFKLLETSPAVPEELEIKKKYLAYLIQRNSPGADLKLKNELDLAEKTKHLLSNNLLEFIGKTLSRGGSTTKETQHLREMLTLISEEIQESIINNNINTNSYKLLKNKCYELQASVQEQILKELTITYKESEKAYIKALTERTNAKNIKKSKNHYEKTLRLFEKEYTDFDPVAVYCTLGKQIRKEKTPKQTLQVYQNILLFIGENKNEVTEKQKIEVQNEIFLQQAKIKLIECKEQIPSLYVNDHKKIDNLVKRIDKIEDKDGKTLSAATRCVKFMRKLDKYSSPDPSLILSPKLNQKLHDTIIYIKSLFNRWFCPFKTKVLFSEPGQAKTFGEIKKLKGSCDVTLSGTLNNLSMFNKIKPLDVGTVDSINGERSSRKSSVSHSSNPLNIPKRSAPSHKLNNS